MPLRSPAALLLLLLLLLLLDLLKPLHVMEWR
jgi:hypothetical protein